MPVSTTICTDFPAELTREASHDSDTTEAEGWIVGTAPMRLKQAESVKADEPAELYELIEKQYERFVIKPAYSIVGVFMAVLYGQALDEVPLGTGVSFL